jgi:transaldolase
MKIFADTADPVEIERWLAYGVIDGITTNPSIMLAAGARDLHTAAVDIATLIGSRPLSVEVVSDDPETIVEQGHQIAAWAPNIVVKVPIITTTGKPCLGAVNALVKQGVQVNVTACMSFGQAMLAAKSGATFVSLFAGRMSDEGLDAAAVISATVDWLQTWGYSTEVIVGSIREAINVQTAAQAGAHVITIPPKFLSQLVDHKYSRFTVQQFLDDGHRALDLATVEAGNGAHR